MAFLYRKWLFRHIIFGYLLVLCSFFFALIFFAFPTSYLDFLIGTIYSCYGTWVIIENNNNIREYQGLKREELWGDE